MEFLHVYSPGTGEFFGFSPAPDQQQKDVWEADGFSVVTSPQKPEPIENYNYKGGVPTPKVAVTLTPDKAEIAADGEDQAVVAVQVAGESPPASIEIEVDGVPAEVALTGGQGQVPPITSPVEHVFTVRAADQITYQDGGGCTVAAVEQE
jgi:hypothetical protein